LSGFVVAGVGRKASKEARMRRFVVPDVLLVPDRAEHTSTTRLLLSIAELKSRRPHWLIDVVPVRMLLLPVNQHNSQFRQQPCQKLKACSAVSSGNLFVNAKTHGTTSRAMLSKNLPTLVPPNFATSHLNRHVKRKELDSSVLVLHVKPGKSA